MLRAIALLLMMVAIGVIAAGGYVLVNAAWHSTNIAWLQPVLAVVVVALCIWEALAVTAAIVLWKNGYKPLVPFAIVFMIAACLFTMRYDVLSQLQAQSDRIASRTASIDHAKTDTTMLSALMKQQASWQARIETAAGRERRELREELDKINAQIAAIMERLNSRTAVGEATPDAAFAARLSGYSEAVWVDVAAVMSILALPVGRLVGTPLAVAFWNIAWARRPKSVAPDKKPVEAASSPVPDEKPQPSQIAAQTLEPQQVQEEPEAETDEPVAEEKTDWTKLPAYITKKATRARDRKRALVEKIVEEYRAEKGIGESIDSQEVEARLSAAFKQASEAPLSPAARGKLLREMGIKPDGTRRMYRVQPRKERGHFIAA